MEARIMSVSAWYVVVEKEIRQSPSLEIGYGRVCEDAESVAQPEGVPRGSDLQLVQIIVADFDTLERIPIALVLLHVEVFHAALGRGLENLFPADHAAANFRKGPRARVMAGGGRKAGFQVLNVKQREASWEAVKVIDGVLSRAHAPKAVQLEVHHPGVCPANQLVVFDDSVHGGIIEVVAVIVEAAACPADRLAEIVEPFCIALDGVERFPVFLAQARQPDVGNAALLCVRDVLFGAGPQLLLVEMQAHALQTGALEDPAEFGRLLAIKVEGAQLYFFVSDLRYPLQRSFQVRLDVAADGVELKPDRLAVGIGNQVPRCCHGERAQTQACAFDEVPSMHS